MSDNTVIISQFAELTQTPLAVAETILSRNDWNLQVSYIISNVCEYDINNLVIGCTRGFL